jgi:hypothetical protein
LLSASADGILDRLVHNAHRIERGVHAQKTQSTTRRDQAISKSHVERQNLTVRMADSLMHADSRIADFVGLIFLFLSSFFSDRGLA